MESSAPEPGSPGRRRHDLTAVIALQHRLADRSSDLPTALAHILEEIVRMTRATGGMFERACADGWTPSAVTGCCTPFERTVRRAPAMAMALDSGLTICEDTLVTGMADRTVCAEIGARSIVAATTTRDGVTFVLSVVSDERAAFSASDGELVQLLAGFASGAVIESERPLKSEGELAGEVATLMAAVQRENQFVKLLQEIAVAANEAASVEEAIRRSIVRICEVTGWPMGHLYLTSEGGDRLVSTSVWHMSHAVRFNALRRLTDGMDWRRKVGLPGRVLEEARPAWVVDLRSDPSIVRTSLASSLGVHSSFALPLLIGAEVVAVLEFFSEQVLEPDERLLEVAGHIGVQLGRVIERKRASTVLAASEQHYRLLFERNLAGVFRTTLDGTILDCNEAFARILGYDKREELRSRSMLDLYPESAERTEHMERLKAERTLTNAELLLQRRDGSRAWTLVNASLLSLGETQVMEGTLLDITARKEEEMQVEFQAHHDALTKLHNRPFFRAQLDKSISLAQRFSRPLALLFIDLDRFKPVNDTLGHAAGDLLLQETAARLVSTVRSSDLVARIGGDEFVVLLTTLAHAGDAETVTQKLLARIGAPIEHNGHELRVTASVGISIYPDDASDPDALMAAADEAMYVAKKSGGHAYRFYEHRGTAVTI